METKKQEDGAAAVNSVPFQFRTPAAIQDFVGAPEKQQLMNVLWSDNLDGFMKQGMLNNPWNSTNTPPTTNYFNPIDGVPANVSAYQIPPWHAFPGRLAYNFPTASQDQLNQMADTGIMPGQILSNPCDSSPVSALYFPYGPRGWQDEYCEWAVTRNAKGKITRIDFTCENPEYWNTLWRVDPNKVRELYQTILNKPQITLEDLSLPNVFDPITSLPVYNPLNKWNTGTVSDATTGGVIHLTSTPNTLQTEIGLSTASTIQRFNPPPPPSTKNTMWSQYNDLICVGKFGQRFRNSDPNIGGHVNNLVTGGAVVTLADPPGLYIQMPDFSNYVTPDGTDASTFWTIARGTKSLTDQDGKALPGNFILHAVFEVPANKNYTVSDISISGDKIAWASQLAATFKIQIVANAYKGQAPQGYSPVGNPAPDATFAQPLQLFYQDYFEAMYNTLVPNPVENPISLLSNSTYVPPIAFLGTTSASMVLISDTCTATPDNQGTWPSVTFDDTNIKATVTKVVTDVEYAVPGNSTPGSYTALYITVSVGANAIAGKRSVLVTNVGQPIQAGMPALLLVTPVTVQAAVAWQNTGIIVTPQSKATITYTSGLWTANPHDNGGKPYDAAGNPSFILARPGYTLPGQNVGALVGQVGDAVFLIGQGAAVPAGLAGEIKLCINDDLLGQYGAGLTDNTGYITVTIDVQ